MKQKDLIRRLRNLVKVLREDDVQRDSPEWPGLTSLAHVLMQTFLSSSDTQVRLYSVLACIEILTIFAPHVPWDETELLQLFRQITRQLGNLAHTGPGQDHFSHYHYILSMLAHFRIGCILVDMARQRHHEDDEDDKEKDDEEATAVENQQQSLAIEVLIELTHTLLHSVRREHPHETLQLVQQAITAFLQDYSPNQGEPCPWPLLDELLVSIGQGPTQWIIAPISTAPTTQENDQPSKRKKQTSKPTAAAAATPQQIEVPNPTYITAAAILRALLDKFDTQISQLLNGLLNAEPYYVEQSSIRCINDESTKQEKEFDIYNIIFEMHRVAPQILTTVIGTIANQLQQAQLQQKQQRWQITNLLGRLFATEQLAEQYTPCFREWMQRKNDIDVDIRLEMVKRCIEILKAKTTKHPSDHSSSSSTMEVCSQTADALAELCTFDASLDVRLAAIHDICDWAYHNQHPSQSHRAVVRLLQAVGNRVSAKNKQERRDAVTGLAHIYFRQHVYPVLKPVVQGGDDCDVQVIIQVMHTMCHHLVFESPTSKSHQRKRRRNPSRQLDEEEDALHGSFSAEEAFGWIPTKVFESVCFTDQRDPEMRTRVVQIMDEFLLGPESKMTPTAQAIAMTMVIDSLLPEGGLSSLLSTHKRAHQSNAFKYLNQLFQQRALLQKNMSRYIDARSEARRCTSGSEAAMEADARAMEILERVANLTAPPNGSPLEDVLQAFHGARDKHIFRIFSTIVDAGHSAEARIRALDELPKRTKALGGPVSEWVKNLVRRCAMGNFWNADILSHCILVAQQCFHEGDIPAASALLASAREALSIFPSLCQTSKTFATLTEFFSACRAATDLTKNHVHGQGLITALSSILSMAALSKPDDIRSDEEEDLKSQLISLCTREGTPEQARNAVYTLVRLLNPSDQCDSSSTNDAVNSTITSLMQTLTSASKLKLVTDDKESIKLVSILSSLSALAESAPFVFQSSSRGEKAIQFALEVVLMGRGHSNYDDDNDDEHSEEDSSSDSECDMRSETPRSLRRGKNDVFARKNCTPDAKVGFLEDDSLSSICRRLCAAVDFLVSYVRFTTLAHYKQKSVHLPSENCVQPLFRILVQIIQDHGLPPSSRDRKHSKSRQDRAALRQCAGISLLALCDARLGLEKKYLTTSMWHTLGNVFLDEEYVVRERIIMELCHFLTGTEYYATGNSYMIEPKAPSLRFLSLVSLCSDSEQGSIDNSVANGGAANVGKATGSIKQAAYQCIVNLRMVSESAYTQCCAMGKQEQFEKVFKMLVMPEYSVPHAFHLIAHRRETPGSDSSNTLMKEDDLPSDDDESDSDGKEATRHKILRRRIKVLFEPLVQSLGEKADNISFLLQMAELVGKYYKPTSIESSHQSKTAKSLESKLKTVCSASREVLLSFVKKDVNLKTFPGEICLPAGLFDCLKQTKANVVRTPKDRKSAQNTKESKERRTSHSSKHGSAQKSVTFSPDVHFKKVSPKPREIILSNSPESTGCLDDLSPIAKPTKSPTPNENVDTPGQNSEGGKTLGTTPPQDVATATMTAFEAESDKSQTSLYDKESETLMASQETEQPSLRSTTQSSDPSTRASLKSVQKIDSQQSSVSAKENKRRHRFLSLVLGENKQRKRSVPTKIVLQRGKNEEKLVVSGAKKVKRGRKDELDFDDTENYVNKKSTATERRSTSRKSRRTT